MAEITIDTDVLKTLLKKAEENENKKNQEGSYYLYKNGKARLSYMLNHEYYRTTVEAKNDDEAKKQLVLFVEKVKKGNFINTNYTFAEFAQIWLDEKIRKNCGERCVKKYIGALNTRILPEIGNIKLKDLTKQKIEKLLNKLKVSKTNYKSRKENTTLKPATIKKWKNIIHSCLEYALELELINKNPCSQIKLNFTSTTTDEKTIKELVKNKRQKINYYNKDEFKNVCNILENEFKFYYYSNTISNNKKLREVGRRMFIMLALKTGMRRSEIFGLTLEDLSIENATFDVNKSRHYLAGKGKYTSYPKNDNSIRKKSLPKSILSYLKMYFDLLYSLDYKEPYIFDYLNIDGICSWFDKWQDKNNIRNIRLHDLRHCHATILLSLGVDIKTISERLGHSNIETTLNIYADVLEELDEKASEKIDSL